MILPAMKEKCAVFGVFSNDLAAARLVYFGLYALQHRGQESSGITASDGDHLRTHKALGLVPQVYSDASLANLPGAIAIGHNRYSTSGGSHDEHSQPVARYNDLVALAHNGNLPSTKKLQKFLTSRGIDISGLNDSEMMQKAIKYYLVKGNSLEDAITKAYPLFTGAFCLLVMTKDKIAAVRDSFGIRPLSIGRLDNSFVIASETCAFDTVNATYLRDVEPGEMVVFSKDGYFSYPLAPANQKLDIFEFVYFSRPDSYLFGKSVYQVRKNLGAELAREHPVAADVVIPVPDSAIPASIGYAQGSGIPFEFGLVKNRYIGRTFILPDQQLRDRGVQMKLNPLDEVIKNKRVIVIDDSIVRGTTAKKLVKMIRDAGAKSVHLMSSCPPVLYPDFYGIDTPSQKQLLAAHMSVPQMREYIGCDSLHFLSYNGMIKATGLPENIFCTSCFTGIYPIDIGEYKTTITKVKTSERMKRVLLHHQKASNETIGSTYIK
jgi:amidophosphoribosyltransferase